MSLYELFPSNEFTVDRCTVFYCVLQVPVFVFICTQVDVKYH